MITMEFDEMKKIWDSQNNELFYGINEKALYNRILSKKKQTYHITNISEWLSIIVNLGMGFLVLGLNFFKQSTNIFMYCLGAWMIAAGLVCLVSRIRRVRTDSLFDRSMRGDLSYAIATATYQVRLSKLLRWNALPIGMLTALAVWESGKSVWLALGILIFLALTIYAAGWEHNIYKTRKRELEILQDTLEREEPGDHPS
jgi:hypothetical protein